MRAYLVAHVFQAYCVVFGLLLVICVCQVVDWLSLRLFLLIYYGLTTFKLPPTTRSHK